MYKEMHNATCADCGDDIQVPFRPTMPVYCRECYHRHKRPMVESRNKNYDKGKVKYKEIKNFEEKRIKPITPDMLERASFNNMVVDQLGFYYQTRYMNISGKQLSLFTLTPSAPLIACKHMTLGMTITDPNDPRTKMNIRMCSKDENRQVVCRKNESCPTELIQLGENGFWVICDGKINNGDSAMPFKIGFFDKIHQTYDPPPIFSKNPDENKALSLIRHYNAARSGSGIWRTDPKPGNGIFRTLFSHENEVTTLIVTKSQKLSGEKIRGVVKGYEDTTRGQPALKLWTNEGRQRPVDISQIAFMLIEDYKAPLWRKISIELMTHGHLILPHPEKGGGMSIDVCNAWKGESDLLIHSNGDLSKRDDNDRHNREVRDTIDNILKIENEMKKENEKKIADNEE